MEKSLEDEFSAVGRSIKDLLQQFRWECDHNMGQVTEDGEKCSDLRESLGDGLDAMCGRERRVDGDS